jgi:hypothetical protein
LVVLTAADFSLLRRVGATGLVKVPGCSFTFAPPEQEDPLDATVGLDADLYSLAVIGYGLYFIHHIFYRQRALHTLEELLGKMTVLQLINSHDQGGLLSGMKQPSAALRKEMESVNVWEGGLRRFFTVATNQNRTNRTITIQEFMAVRFITIIHSVVDCAGPRTR